MKKILYNNLILFKIYLKIDPKFVIFKQLSSVFQIIQPLSSVYLFKLFLDGIFVKKSFSYCVNVVGVIIFINLLAQIVSVLINNRNAPISNQKTNAKITKDILNKYLKVDMKNLNNSDFYNKYTQVINDIPNRVILLQDNLCNFLGNILSIVTVITLIVKINPIMIIISLVSVIVSLIVTPIINKIGYKSYLEKTKDNRMQSYIKRIFYIYDYAKELKLYSINKLLLNQFDAASLNLIKNIKKYSFKNIFFILLMGIINLMSFVVILLYLAYNALKGLLTMGEVSALYNATEQLKADIISFFSIMPIFMENNLYVDNYLEFISINSCIETSAGKELEDFKYIKFDDVSFSYSQDDNKLSLYNINLVIEKNQKIALVGSNGAGKSTFVNILVRMFDPLKGNIYFDDVNYREINIFSLRKNFLVVLQDCQQYALTIAENILMRSIESEKDAEIVIDALKKVGLFEKIMSFDKGINAVLTKEFDDGVILSGGEMQKLFVAKVLACDAKIIVLDEVTSNMDAISEHEVFDQILKYAESKTIIYISHKLSTTKIADKIYLFDQGKIMEQGNHEFLMNLRGVYQKMFTVQAEKYGDISII